MKVLVHFTIGNKEMTLQGDAPLFDSEPEAEHQFKELGFFLFRWKDVEQRGVGHREWCFIPWSNCWVEKMELPEIVT